MNTLQKIGIFLILIMCFVFVHEFTHVAFNGFRVESACVFSCKQMVNDGGLLGNGYTPVGIYLIKPINPLALNEEVANAFAVMFFVMSLIGFVIVGIVESRKNPVETPKFQGVLFFTTTKIKGK